MNELGLDAFMLASAQGALVWVQLDRQQAHLSAGPRPHAEAGVDVGELFVQALRERFGLAASAVAEREFGLSQRRCTALPARTIVRAAACAESALAMLMAQATVLRFECSAEFLGRRYVQLCAELGMGPKALSPERRHAIDEAMFAYFTEAQAPTAEQARSRLQALLTQPLH